MGQWSRLAIAGVIGLCCLVWFIISTCTETTTIEPGSGTATFKDNVPVPFGWEGVWEITIDELDEETGQLHVKTVWSDTLNAGDTISSRFGSFLSDYEGHIVGDSLVFSAAESWMEGLCSVKFILQINASRTDDSLSGAGEWRIEASGVCGDTKSVAGREVIKLSGKRTAKLSSGK